MAINSKKNRIETIPENWKEVVFSDVVDINPKRTLAKGTVAKHIAMEYIKPFQKQINNYTLRKFNGGSKFQNNDTLFARITPSLENGKTGFVNILDEEETGFGSTEFIVMSAREGKILSNYVYYLSRTHHVRNTAINAMTGTSGRQRVDDAVFNHMLIRIPAKIQEQSRISKILSDFDSKIELLQKQNKILEQIARAIFKSWFVDFDRVTEFEDSELGKIPMGWKIDSLDSIADNIKDSIRTTDIKSNFFYIGLEHMPRGSIALTNWENAKNLQSNKFRFSTNQLLFGKLRPYFKKVGIAPVNGICSTDILVLDGKDPIWNEFILFIMSSDKFIQFASQSATGTRMPRSNWNYMKTYPIVIPPLLKILTFHHIVKKNLEKINNNIFEIISLTKIRDVLLPKLMSGEIRV